MSTFIWSSAAHGSLHGSGISPAKTTHRKMNAILAVILKQCRECDVMGPNGSDACFIGNFLMCSCITDVCPNTLWFSLKWDGSQQPL